MSEHSKQNSYPSFKIRTAFIPNICSEFFLSFYRKTLFSDTLILLQKKDKDYGNKRQMNAMALLPKVRLLWLPLNTWHHRRIIIKKKQKKKKPDENRSPCFVLPGNKDCNSERRLRWGINPVRQITFPVLRTQKFHKGIHLQVYS